MTQALLATSPIGRQSQLDDLRGWVAELTAGRGRAVLVEGEPGIGKTSLVRAVTTAAAAAGCEVLWASCDELSQAFPLLPLLDTLDSQTLEGRPKIAEMLRADTGPGRRVDLVAATVERILTVLDEMCAATPVMLVVDDLQWADPATVTTVGRLARSVRQLPLLVVGMTRPVPRREDLIALRRAVEPSGVAAPAWPDRTTRWRRLSRTGGGTPGRRSAPVGGGRQR